MEEQLTFRVRHLIARAPKRLDPFMYHFPQNRTGSILNDIGRTKINNPVRLNRNTGVF